MSLSSHESAKQHLREQYSEDQSSVLHRLAIIGGGVVASAALLLGFSADPSIRRELEKDIPSFRRKVSPDELKRIENQETINEFLMLVDEVKAWNPEDEERERQVCASLTKQVVDSAVSAGLSASELRELHQTFSAIAAAPDKQEIAEQVLAVDKHFVAALNSMEQ